MKQYYVYEWFDVETNNVFYVGKGTGKRYKNVSNRNKFFLEHYNSNLTDVRIIKYFSNEEEAFKYEKELTNSYRMNNQCQCNLIDGGYGGYSSAWTPEMRKYMSIHNPMKAEVQRERMSEFNPMKDKEVSLRVGQKHKRPVVINGVLYDGTVDAAKDLQVWENTILNWCKKGYNTQGQPCRYADEKQKEYSIKKTCSKAILLDDQEFPSLRAAADSLGIKDTSPLCKALKAERPYKGHIVKYVNQQPSQ